MVTVAHSAESAAARATTAEKVTGQAGEPLWKTLGMVILVMACIGLFVYKAFEPAANEEEKPVESPRKQVTAAELLQGLAPLPRGREEKPATTESSPTPAPPATPPPAPPVTPSAPETSPIVPVAMRSPVVAVSSIAVRNEPAAPPPTRMAAPSVRMRHVPRGTIMSGFLESRILSDNLDGRVRVQLVEDYRLGDDVILPAGGIFIGEAMEVGSRYQKRLAVHLGNYIYPDGEREVVFSGLLLNPDESAHLVADDVTHHTGKLIAGTTALAALGAVTGVFGSARGDGLGAIAGANAAAGLGDLAQRNVEGLTEIMPTLIVEPGKPCWIFVDQSFDVPSYAELPGTYAPLGSPAAPPAGPASDPRFDMMKAQLSQVESLLGSLPAGGGLGDVRR